MFCSTCKLLHCQPGDDCYCGCHRRNGRLEFEPAWRGWVGPTLAAVVSTALAVGGLVFALAALWVSGH